MTFADMLALGLFVLTRNDSTISRIEIIFEQPFF